MRSPPPRPSIEILARTYHGDELQLLHNLIPTLGIFVNRREYRFSLVLDEECAADHALGARLLANDLCDRVSYEPLPSDWKNLFQGVAFPPPYNRWGYDRQQWSTFYMDAQSDRDVLGVVDSDATFYTYLTRQNIFSGDGRIMLTVCRPSRLSPWEVARMLVRSEDECAYRNDKVALGEDSPYECMMTNRMPIWFWRSTYEACRKHVERHWNTSFDTAFASFSRAPYCAFNILANYAIKYEPERYKIRLFDSPDEDVISVAQNGCLSALDMVAGGLRTFRFTPEDGLPEQIRRVYHDLMADRIHLNRLAHEACAVTISAPRAEQHYAKVWEDVEQLSPEQRNLMRERFLDFVRNGLHKVKLVSHLHFTFRKKLEWEIGFLFRRHRALKLAALRLVELACFICRPFLRWARRQSRAR